MARLDLTRDTVHLRLTTGEKLGALSGDVHIPRRAITGVEVVDEPLRAMRGLRAPGLALPGVVKAGTWRGGGRGRQFVAVRKGRRGVRVSLHGHRYDEVLVAVDDPEGVAAQLAPRGRA